MMGQDVNDGVARRLAVVTLQDGKLVLVVRSVGTTTDHIELTFKLDLSIH